MKYFLILISVIFLGFSMLYGGTIKGVVTDQETSDPLIGANVILGKTPIGTITDDDGLFILQNVPTGKWQLHVNYIGYIDVTRDVIVGNQPLELDIKMQPTVFKGSEVIVEVNRAEERKTPVAFSEVGESQIQNRYATQDVPDLLSTIPGVFTTTTGLGESAIFIRGFDAERIQILINGIPVNDPESQVVYWSNWTGLSGNAASIQVQRGVGASLVGSGAFGGSVNIVTSKFSPERLIKVRTSIAGYYTTGGYDETSRIADGVGGAQTYNPFNQVWSVDYTSGLLFNGKLNIYLKYERKSGDYYLVDTYYNGHSFYLGLQSILGKHILTFNAHGAPQRHLQATASQDRNLLDRLGREYNRYNHPYQENYYFKPQFELHWDWAISEKAYMKTNVFVTFGRGGGRYLRNDLFNVNNGNVGFRNVSEYTDWLEFGRHARFVYENVGVALYGYNPTNQTYRYGSIEGPVTRSRMLTSSQYEHSWLNDSQNNHNQFGLNLAYQRNINRYFTFVVGGEGRHWKARHRAQSFYFREYDLATGAATQIEEVQQRYDYDGIVTNLSGFARLLVNPVEPLTLMLDGQYASYSSKVEERPMQIFDFGVGTFTPYSYLSTKDKKDPVTGQPLFTENDYERTFTFFMPKFGANYNLSREVNVYANYSISKKEPKVGDWYARDSGPGVNQPSGQKLKEETLTNIEVGTGYQSRFVGFKGNFYIMNFKDKIESVVDRSGDRITINAGKAKYTGVELQATARYRQYDAALSGTWAHNRWQDMNVNEIFDFPAQDVVDKVVPFFPERMFYGEAGYNFGPFRFAFSANYWDRYFGNYDNTASLPAFFSLNAIVTYTFILGGADVDMRLNLNNLSSRKNFTEASWAQDFNRSDGMTDYYMYVAQAPLFHTFFTTMVTF